MSRYQLGRRKRLLATGVLVAITLTPSLPSLASATALPSWAKALGTGVVVDPPTPTAAGYGSPGAPVKGVYLAFAAGNLVQVCRYFEPTVQQKCVSLVAGKQVNYTASIKNFGPGYVAIDHQKALVGVTGTYCISNEKPTCSTNTNPAAIFDLGKTFAVQWADAVAASNSNANVYSLTPSIEVGHKWYVYVPPSEY